MLYQEVTVAKAPKDTDARNTGVGCSLDIDVAVTNIYAPLLPHS